MLDPALRSALLKKLGYSPQALSQRVQRLKADHPLTSEEAACIIAHRIGISLDKYLSVERVNHIRTTLRDIGPTRAQPLSYPKHQPSNKKATTVVICGDFTEKDAVLPTQKLREAKEMAAIYPLLYVMENSIRHVIESTMAAKHGPDWWEAKAPSGLKSVAAERMADDGKHPWHQRRGSRPIDYLDLNQLPALMRKIASDVVPSVIPSIEWFQSLVDEVYRSRCVLCHMNPLDADNIDSVKLRFRQWRKQVKGKVKL